MIKKSEAEQLLKDDTFVKVFDIIRQEQINKFLLSGKGDADEREDAHSIIQAVKRIEHILKRAITDEDMKDKRNK